MRKKLPEVEKITVLPPLAPGDKLLVKIADRYDVSPETMTALKDELVKALGIDPDVNPLIALIGVDVSVLKAA